MEWNGVRITWGKVREQGLKNAEKIRATRDWVHVVPRFDELFSDALAARPMDWRPFYRRCRYKPESYELPDPPVETGDKVSYAQHLARVQGRFGENYQSARAELVPQATPNPSV